MQHISAYPLLYEFSRVAPPRCRIEPGETICVESEDALSGQIRQPGDRRDKTAVPFSNPVAGPILVTGAEPGDELAVSIQSIEPRDGQCATYTAPPRQLGEWLGPELPPHGAHVCPIRDGIIVWKNRASIPYRPMLGCIGTAPDWGTPTTGPAGPHGGNLDLVEVCPGSTVYLPVKVPGAYLYLGDAHAVMGHGELSGTGLEMAAHTTVTVNLIKRPALTGLRIAHPEFLLCAAVHGNHERAIAEAYSRLILWMESDFGWNRWDAYDLLTHVGQLSIGYYASGAVGAKIDRNYVHAL